MKIKASGMTWMKKNKFMLKFPLYYKDKLKF